MNIRKLGAEAARQATSLALVAVVAFVVASCGTDALGGLAGAIPGLDAVSGAAPAAGAPAAGSGGEAYTLERLHELIDTLDFYSSITQERDSWKDLAVDRGRDLEEIEQRIRDQVAELIDVPDDVTQPNAIVALLITELTAALDQEKDRADAAEEQSAAMMAAAQELAAGLTGQEESEDEESHP